MRRAWKWVALAVVVIVAAGGFGFWYFWLRDDAPPPAALPDRTQPTGAPDSTSGDAADPGADGTWTVLPGEGVFVGYRVEELFAGDTLQKTAVGRTPAVEGTVTIDGTQVTEATFTADLTQLDSDQDRRDNYLQSNSLQTNDFPEATFTLTEPIDFGATPTVGEEVAVTANGDLTLHGVTKAVQIELDARWNGDSIDVAGELPVQFADYDIDRPSVPILTTEDNGIMELVLTFQRA
jgi:polyisoprenoid-binding protein YceI